MEIAEDLISKPKEIAPRIISDRKSLEASQ